MPRKTKPKANAKGVVLLSGGNPQIAKADGDAPVQAYIAAMPGWKHDIREDDQIDEAQMATWIRQAAALPGWAP